MKRRWFTRATSQAAKHRHLGNHLDGRYRRLKAELLEDRVALAADMITLGAGAGGGPHVRSFEAAPTLGQQQNLFAYAPAFSGGVRVASGDVTGDGQADTITGAGPGGGPHVRIFNGPNGQLLNQFMAFEPGFVGGIHVAAGDINQDGRAEIFVGADGPTSSGRVRVFNAANGQVLHDLVIPGFGGGVRVAAGDVNGDGRAELIMGAGTGSSPRVVVRDLQTGQNMADFMAYSATFQGGIFVAAGDFTGDGRHDIVTGPDVGGGPHVRIFNGATGQEVRGLLAYGAAFTGGVRVATTDFNRDGVADLMTGAGPGGGPHVRILNGSNFASLHESLAYSASFTGGVYLGADPLDLVTPPPAPLPVPTAGVDLASGGLNVVESAAQWGSIINVQTAIRNLGLSGTGAGFLLRWYLSRDAVGSADDILLLRSSGAGSSFSHNPLNGNSVGGSFQFTLQLPGAPPPGFVGSDFHVVMYTDYAGQIAESDESNNFGQLGAGLDSEAISITFTAPPAPAPGGFQIQLDTTGLSVTQLVAFQRAADRWEQIITGDLEDVVFNGRAIDDVLIDASAVFIDGPGGILGGAAPLNFRTTDGLPFFGIMQFDTFDLLNLENQFALDEVILHEMGHVLGVGSIWAAKNLLFGSGTLDPRFTGPLATAEYNKIFGLNEPNVPVENFFAGPGSGESHFRDSVFINELMTPFVRPPNVPPFYLPLSRVTIASLADMGYTVNLAVADLFVPVLGVQFIPITSSSFSSSANSPAGFSFLREESVDAQFTDELGADSKVSRSAAALAAHARAADVVFAQEHADTDTDARALDLLAVGLGARLSDWKYDILNDPLAE